MKNLFTMLPFVVQNPALTKVPATDVEQLLPNYEFGAYDLWIFSESASSLIGAMNSKLMLPQSSQPEYFSDHLTILSNNGYSLQSDLLDSGGSKTICGVFKLSTLSVAPTITIGTIGSTNGFGLFIQDGGVVKVNARGALSAATVVGNVVANDWIFMAVSLCNEPPNKQIICKIGDSNPVIVPYSNTYLQSNEPVAIGASRLVGAATGVSIGVSEVLAFETHLTAGELNDVYVRMAIRAQTKGIQI